MAVQAKKAMRKRAAAKPRPASAKAKARVETKAAPGELITLLDHVRFAVSRLNAAGVVFAHGTTDAVAEAAFIVTEALHLHPDHLEVFATARVTRTESARIVALIEARVTTRKPAAYLLNRIYMRGVPFYIDERAIVPRSFIGELLEQHFDGGDASLIDDPGEVSRVLDLCTGSGCLAILAARAFPGAAIEAVELSKDALEVAKRNVAEHGLAGRIALYRGDLFAPLGAVRYDLIITNPPYVDAEGMAGLPRECRHEPQMAFDGGADGLAVVRRILQEARRHLTPEGGLLCEVGRGRGNLEAAFPELPFLWLDTEDSSGEVFWLPAAALPAPTGISRP